jgi:hypothetical protein
MVRTSMRRIEKEGLVRLAFKYLYCELYVVTGRPIREVPFDYEFAAFAPTAEKGGHPAIEALRTQIGGLADAVFSASSGGVEALVKLGSTDVSPTAFDRTLHELAGTDVKRIERYIGARVRLARRTPRKAAERIRAAGGAIWRGLGGDSE